MTNPKNEVQMCLTGTLKLEMSNLPGVFYNKYAL